jgi:hypothetical protein
MNIPLLIWKIRFFLKPTTVLRESIVRLKPNWEYIEG